MDIIVKWRQLAEPNDQVDPPRPTPKNMPHSSCTSYCSTRAKRVCQDCMLMGAALPKWLLDKAYHLAVVGCMRGISARHTYRRRILPVAQVIWVDLLTEEEFTAGFGSHTPMFTGQTKCVRYYMNFQRALGLLKEVLAEVWRDHASPYQLSASLNGPEMCLCPMALPLHAMSCPCNFGTPSLLRQTLTASA